MNKYIDPYMENSLSSERFKLSMKCQEDEICLNRSYIIESDNLFEAKLQADEKIKTVHVLKEFIEEAEISVYNRAISDWEVIFKYDCKDQDNIVNNSPIYESDYLRVDRDILNQLRRISSKENISIDNLLKSMIDNCTKQEEKEMGEKSIAECNHRTEDGFQDTIIKDPDTGEYKCSQCGYVFPSEDKKDTDKKNSSFFKLMIVYSESKKRFREFYEIPSDDFLEAKSKANKIIKAIPSSAIIEKVVLCRCDMEF